MAFYQPRAGQVTRFPNVQQMRQTGGVQTGSTATTQAPSQMNHQNMVQDVGGLYNTGKIASTAYDKAGTLLDRWMMPSGVNPESILASTGSVSGFPSSATGFLSGGAAFPSGSATGTGTASFLSGGAPVGLLEGGGAELGGYGSTLLTGIESPAIASSVGLGAGGASGAGLAGAETAGLLGAEAAGAGALGAGSAGAAGAAGAGALGAEAGLLSALGPIGLAAGIGLLGTKLFGLW